jgi:hypothetical protein
VLYEAGIIMSRIMLPTRDEDESAAA